MRACCARSSRARAPRSRRRSSLRWRACAALPFFGAGFLPELKEGHFTLHMAAVPGTSIAESQRIGTLVTNALLELPYVRVVSQRIGRAEKADDTWGTHYSEFEVDLKRDLSGAESDEAQAAMRKVLVGLPRRELRAEAVPHRARRGIAVGLHRLRHRQHLRQRSRRCSTRRRAASRASWARSQGATEVQLQSPPGMPQLTIRQRKAGSRALGPRFGRRAQHAARRLPGRHRRPELRGQPRLQRDHHARRGEPQQRRQGRRPAAAHARPAPSCCCTRSPTCIRPRAATRCSTSAASACRRSPPTSSAATSPPSSRRRARRWRTCSFRTACTSSSPARRRRRPRRGATCS